MLSIKKLEKAMSAAKMNKADLCRVTGMGRPTLDAILKGGDTRLSTLEIIANALNLPIGDLLKDECIVNITPQNITSRSIPFYDASTTGGINGNVSSSLTEASLKGYINSGDWFNGRETAAIRHYGDSMLEYPDGCVLVVREVTNKSLLVPGQNYVIETDEYRVTKRYQRGSTSNTITLYSSNEDRYSDGRLIHEPFDIEISDIRRIFSVLGYIVNQAGDYRLITP